MIAQLSDSRLDLMAQISNNINNIQDEIITISDLYYHDRHVSDITALSSVSYDVSETYRTHMKALDSYVADTLSNYDFTYEIQLICDNGFTYDTVGMAPDTLDSYSRQLWYVDLMSSDEDLFWLSSLTINGTSPTDNDYFSLIRKIKSSHNDTSAILIISVDERVLYNAYKEQITDESSIYLIDRQGRIVSHPVDTMTGRVFYDMQKLNSMFGDKDNTFIKKLGADYLFSRYDDPEYEWITIEEIPLITIVKPIQQITTVILFIAIIVGAVCILLSILTASSVSTPLTNVYASMRRAQKGQFDTPFPRSGFLEARGIAEACEGFVRKIVELHENLRINEEEKHKLELDFLQAQINPHFLYNTFFTIKCMVDMNYNQEACTMIDSLTGILKATLGSSGQYTTIHSEMTLLEQYGYILLKRYKGLFTISFDVDKSIDDLYILHFLIQPILENAIFHGFATMKSGGHILIAAKNLGEQISISVQDNGCGMEQNTIDSVFVEPNDYDHIGLHNVYKRIKLHYDTTANMTIESTMGEGTVVTILVPKILKSNPDIM